ncbi:MAG: hypothetical protein WCR98_02850 [Saccharofermentanales bacterium]
MICDLCGKESDDCEKIHGEFRDEYACEECMDALTSTLEVDQCTNCNRWFKWYYLVDGYCEECLG